MSHFDNTIVKHDCGSLYLVTYELKCDDLYVSNSSPIYIDEFDSSFSLGSPSKPVCMDSNYTLTANQEFVYGYVGGQYSVTYPTNTFVFGGYNTSSANGGVFRDCWYNKNWFTYLNGNWTTDFTQYRFTNYPYQAIHTYDSNPAMPHSVVIWPTTTATQDTAYYDPETKILEIRHADFPASYVNKFVNLLGWDAVNDVVLKGTWSNGDKIYFMNGNNVDTTTLYASSTIHTGTSINSCEAVCYVYYSGQLFLVQ